MAEKIILPTADAPPAKSRNTVFVYCKLPNGLTIYLEEKGPATVGSVEPISQMIPESKVFLNGVNSTRKPSDQSPLLILGAYGITEVDAEFWAEWESKHKSFAPLKSGMLGAASTRERANSMAIERRAELSGFEPIDPANPPTPRNDKGLKIQAHTAA